MTSRDTRLVSRRAPTAWSDGWGLPIFSSLWSMVIAIAVAWACLESAGIWAWLAAHPGIAKPRRPIQN